MKWRIVTLFSLLVWSSLVLAQVENEWVCGME